MITTLAEMFNREVSAPALEAYWVGLQDIPSEAMEIAFKSAVRECRFMPSVAELRELAGEPSKQDRATIAWDCVLESVAYGPYKHISFVDDRISNATIRSLGGWPTFISRFSDAESEKWVRKEFIDTYRSLHRMNVDGEICRPLSGLSGGTFADGREYVPKIVEVRTKLPALPAPARESLATRSPDVPRVELKQP